MSRVGSVWIHDAAVSYSSAFLGSPAGPHHQLAFRSYHKQFKTLQYFYLQYFTFDLDILVEKINDVRHHTGRLSTERQLSSTKTRVVRYLDRIMGQ